MGTNSTKAPRSDEKMKNLGLLVFKPGEAATVVRGLGLSVDQRGFLKAGTGPTICACCGDGIKLSEFGAALPGSRLYYCDAPACLLNYVNRRRASKKA